MPVPPVVVDALPVPPIPSRQGAVVGLLVSIGCLAILVGLGVAYWLTAEPTPRPVAKTTLPVEMEAERKSEPKVTPAPPTPAPPESAPPPPPPPNPAPAAPVKVDALFTLPALPAALARPVVQLPPQEQLIRQLLTSSVFLQRFHREGGKIASNSVGSGVLVDREHGLVLTNYHVVEDGVFMHAYFPEYRDNELITQPAFYLSQSRLAHFGRIVFIDPTHDLALVQLQTYPSKARAVRLAKDSAKQGQALHTIGGSGINDGTLWRYSPGTVRQVYAKKFTLSPTQHLNSWILESTAPINQGDSGGPVVNDVGELVAVVSSFRTDKRELSNNIDIREIHTLLEQFYRRNNLKPSEAPALQLRLVQHDLPAVWKDLASSDAQVRLQGCRRLGDHGERVRLIVPWLVGHLLTGPPEHRVALAATLEQIGPPLPSDAVVLSRATLSEVPEAKVYAIKMMGEIGIPDPALVPILLTTLADANLDAVRAAAAALGHLSGDTRQAAVQALLEVAADRRPGLHAAASRALVRMRPFSRAELLPLRAGLKHTNNLVRLAASTALENHASNSAEALALWKDLLNDDDNQVRLQATCEIAQFDNAAVECQTTLIKRASDPVAGVRRWAFAGLGLCPRKAELEGLFLRGFADDDELVRTAVFQVVKKWDLKEPVHHPFVKQLLQSPTGLARLLAYVTILNSTANRPDLVSILKPALDREPLEQLLALRVLGQIGAPAVDLMPKIETLILGPPRLELDNLKAAITTLGKFGPKAVPTLLKLSSDPAIVNARKELAIALRPFGVAARDVVPTAVPWLREEALVAVTADLLVAIGEPAIPTLTSALKTGQPDDLRREIVTVLSRMGKVAKDAKKALYILSWDRTAPEELRQQAREAEKKVTAD
jgi:S1-C subfamily serine protease/HEAT repeat protein